MAQGFGKMAGQNISACLRLAAMAVLVAAFAACSPIYRNHGYVPSDEELALIEVGKDTRESVATVVGRPSASGLLNDEGWYYVQSKWKTLGIKAPKEEVRQVVAISFDDNGVVQNIERFGLEKGRIVPISRRVTDDNIKGKGILAQMFGNIGGIGAGDLLKR
jgi:outer membrane protein assembly factor BamE (lipoprotein component of BamABCDE complex)